MKQGQASNSGPGARAMTRPVPKMVNPGGASQIGEALGNHATDAPGKILHGASEPLYKGRGYEAPEVKTTIHHAGGQGRHD